MAISTDSLMTTSAEDAYAFLAKIIHDHINVNRLSDIGRNGFDVDLPIVIQKYLPSGLNAHTRGLGQLTGKPKEIVYRAFFDAAWQMCLAGLLLRIPVKAAVDSGEHGSVFRRLDIW